MRRIILIAIHFFGVAFCPDGGTAESKTVMPLVDVESTISGSNVVSFEKGNPSTFIEGSAEGCCMTADTSASCRPDVAGKFFRITYKLHRVAE